jgi:hypothetical protein
MSIDRRWCGDSSKVVSLRNREVAFTGQRPWRDSKAVERSRSLEPIVSKLELLRWLSRNCQIPLAHKTKLTTMLPLAGKPNSSVAITVVFLISCRRHPNYALNAGRAMNVSSGDQISDSTTRVSDGRIWAAICYLDSASDFREFLPNNNSRRICRGDDFVLLDDTVSDEPALLGWLFACACVFLSAAVLLDFWI